MAALLAAMMYSCTVFASMEEADKLYREKKYAEAVAAYRNELAGLTGEKAALVQIKIGYSVYNQRKFEEAETEFRKVKDIEGATTRSLVRAQYFLGLSLYSNGKKYDEAVEELRKTVNMEGVDETTKHNSQYFLGDSFFRNKKYDETIAEFRKFLEMMQGKTSFQIAEAYYRIGTSLYRLKKYDEAIAELEKVKDAPEARAKTVKLAGKTIEDCRQAKEKQE